MPKYIMLSNLTDEGRKTVKMRPERIKEVNDEIEKMGAKVLEQYAVLGEYDFINILEAPNNETISKVSIDLGSRGTIQFITLAGFHTQNIAIFELAEKYKKEGMAAYSRIQEQEFSREKDGYTSVKHQREVGTSYFDAVSNTISSGTSSTTAMAGSTESEQF